MNNSREKKPSFPAENIYDYKKPPKQYAVGGDKMNDSFLKIGNIFQIFFIGERSNNLRDFIFFNFAVGIFPMVPIPLL